MIRKMATFFGSPPFVCPPIARTQHLSSSSQPSPPPSEPPLQPPSLIKSSQELQPPLPPLIKSSARDGKARSTSADSTDWIASSLTRRFGLGAGLAWAGFLAFGVVSEQIKTRLEVNQQQANTRFVLEQTSGHECTPHLSGIFFLIIF